MLCLKETVNFFYRVHILQGIQFDNPMIFGASKDGGHVFRADFNSIKHSFAGMFMHLNPYSTKEGEETYERQYIKRKNRHCGICKWYFVYYWFFLNSWEIIKCQFCQQCESLLITLDFMQFLSLKPLINKSGFACNILINLLLEEQSVAGFFCRESTVLWESLVSNVL